MHDDVDQLANLLPCSPRQLTVIGSLSSFVMGVDHGKLNNLTAESRLVADRAAFETPLWSENVYERTDAHENTPNPSQPKYAARGE